MTQFETARVAAGGRAEEVPGRPVDLAHLARQTMGNRDLEREVLHLFIGQSERILARLADPAQDRAQAAHMLLGSARGIGAHGVAAAAEAVETAARRDPAAAVDAEIEALRWAVEAANRFIRSLVRAA
jgi:HPt (histidine-containing phosphotransfer) domain-containing protein